MTTSSPRQAKRAKVRDEFDEELANANEILGILDSLVLELKSRDRLLAARWKDVMRTPKPRGRPRTKKRKLPPYDSTAAVTAEPPRTA